LEVTRQTEWRRREKAVEQWTCDVVSSTKLQGNVEDGPDFPFDQLHALFGLALGQVFVGCSEGHGCAHGLKGTEAIGQQTYGFCSGTFSSSEPRNKFGSPFIANPTLGLVASACTVVFGVGTVVLQKFRRPRP
jgi:hypothetical protein